MIPYENRARNLSIISGGTPDTLVPFEDGLRNFIAQNKRVPDGNEFNKMTSEYIALGAKGIDTPQQKLKWIEDYILQPARALYGQEPQERTGLLPTAVDVVTNFFSTAAEQAKTLANIPLGIQPLGYNKEVADLMDKRMGFKVPESGVQRLSDFRGVDEAIDEAEKFWGMAQARYGTQTDKVLPKIISGLASTPLTLMQKYPEFLLARGVAGPAAFTAMQAAREFTRPFEEGESWQDRIVTATRKLGAAAVMDFLFHKRLFLSKTLAGTVAAGESQLEHTIQAKKSNELLKQEFMGLPVPVPINPEISNPLTSGLTTAWLISKGRKLGEQPPEPVPPPVTNQGLLNNSPTAPTATSKAGQEIDFIVKTDQVKDLMNKYLVSDPNELVKRMTNSQKTTFYNLVNAGERGENAIVEAFKETAFPLRQELFDEIEKAGKGKDFFKNRQALELKLPMSVRGDLEDVINYTAAEITLGAGTSRATAAKSDFDMLYGKMERDLKKSTINKIGSFYNKRQQTLIDNLKKMGYNYDALPFHIKDLINRYSRGRVDRKLSSSEFFQKINEDLIKYKKESKAAPIQSAIIDQTKASGVSNTAPVDAPVTKESNVAAQVIQGTLTPAAAPEPKMGEGEFKEAVAPSQEIVANIMNMTDAELGELATDLKGYIDRGQASPEVKGGYLEVQKEIVQRQRIALQKQAQQVPTQEPVAPPQEPLSIEDQINKYMIPESVAKISTPDMIKDLEHVKQKIAEGRDDSIDRTLASVYTRVLEIRANAGKAQAQEPTAPPTQETKVEETKVEEPVKPPQEIVIKDEAELVQILQDAGFFEREIPKLVEGLKSGDPEATRKVELAAQGHRFDGNDLRPVDDPRLTKNKQRLLDEINQLNSAIEGFKEQKKKGVTIVSASDASKILGHGDARGGSPDDLIAEWGAVLQDRMNSLGSYNRQNQRYRKSLGIEEPAPAPTGTKKERGVMTLPEVAEFYGVDPSIMRAKKGKLTPEQLAVREKMEALWAMGVYPVPIKEETAVTTLDGSKIVVNAGTVIPAPKLKSTIVETEQQGLTPQEASGMGGFTTVEGKEGKQTGVSYTGGTVSGAYAEPYIELKDSQGNKIGDISYDEFKRLTGRKGVEFKKPEEKAIEPPIQMTGVSADAKAPEPESEAKGGTEAKGKKRVTQGITVHSMLSQIKETYSKGGLKTSPEDLNMLLNLLKKVYKDTKGIEPPPEKVTQLQDDLIAALSGKYKGRQKEEGETEVEDFGVEDSDAEELAFNVGGNRARKSISDLLRIRKAVNDIITRITGIRPEFYDTGDIDEASALANPERYLRGLAAHGLNFRTAEEALRFAKQPGGKVIVGQVTRNKPGEWVIRLAIDETPEPEAIKTGYHEAEHYLESTGLLSKPEIDLLEAKFGNKEGRANAFSDWVTGRSDRQTPVVTRIFTKVRDFFTKIGNFLRGQGFRTYEDVFKGMMEGKYAQGVKEPVGPPDMALALGDKYHQGMRIISKEDAKNLLAKGYKLRPATLYETTELPSRKKDVVWIGEGGLRDQPYRIVSRPADEMSFQVSEVKEGESEPTEKKRKYMEELEGLPGHAGFLVHPDRKTMTPQEFKEFGDRVPSEQKRQQNKLYAVYKKWGMSNSKARAYAAANAQKWFQIVIPPDSKKPHWFTSLPKLLNMDMSYESSMKYLGMFKARFLPIRYGAKGGPKEVQDAYMGTQEIVHRVDGVFSKLEDRLNKTLTDAQIRGNQERSNKFLYLVERMHSMHPGELEMFRRQSPDLVNAAIEFRKIEDTIFRMMKRVDPSIKYQPGHFNHYPVRMFMNKLVETGKTLDDSIKKAEDSIKEAIESGETDLVARYAKNLEYFKAKKYEVEENLKEVAIEDSILDRQRKGGTTYSSWFGPFNESRKLGAKYEYSNDVFTVMKRYMDGSRRKLTMDLVLPKINHAISSMKIKKELVNPKTGKAYRKLEVLPRDMLNYKTFLLDYADTLNGTFDSRTFLFAKDTVRGVIDKLNKIPGVNLDEGKAGELMNMGARAILTLNYYRLLLLSPRFPLLQMLEVPIKAPFMFGPNSLIKGFLDTASGKNDKLLRHYGIELRESSITSEIEGIPGKLNRFNVAVSKPHRSVENFTRRWVGNMVLEYARKKGATPKQQREMVAAGVDFVLNRYGADYRPMLYSTRLGRVAGQFQQYAIGTSAYFYDLLKAGRVKDVIFSIGALYAIGGLKGAVPLYDEWRRGLARATGIVIPDKFENPTGLAISSILAELGLDEPMFDIGAAVNPLSFRSASMVGPTASLVNPMNWADLSVIPPVKNIVDYATGQQGKSRTGKRYSGPSILRMLQLAPNERGAMQELAVAERLGGGGGESYKKAANRKVRLSTPAIKAEATRQRKVEREYPVSGRVRNWLAIGPPR